MSVAKPRIRADLEIVEIDGEAVVYDPANGSLHHLNATATVIATLLDGSTTIRGVAEELADAYDLPAQEVEPNVRTLIRQLRKLELLEGARA